MHEASSIVRLCKTTLQKLTLTGTLLLSVGACTMTVHSVVKDDTGKPLKDAVVYAMPAGGQRTAPTSRKDAVMVENSTFLPFVLPVQVGTAVSFLNQDEVQHHIYSVSPAKRFDLSLDKDATAGPVALDAAGVVVLGCAIHDKMVGYLFVTETPYFAKTGEEGTADLTGLPRGTYDVYVWHPWMKAPPGAAAKRVVPSPTGDTNLDFVVTLQSRASREPPFPVFSLGEGGG